jgi:hypothetical protein
MRRTLLSLALATGIAIGGSVATAGSAAAAPSSTKSVQSCGSEHPGKHSGWYKTGKGERRNLGGTCPVP